MKYRAVLFDLDGTLLDTLKDIADSVNSVLARFGLPQHDVAAYRNFVGDGLEVMTVRAFPEEHRNGPLVAEAAARIEEEYAKRWALNTRPYPDIPELLDSLTKLGTRLAILSNKPRASAEAMVSKLLPRWRFECVVGAAPHIPKKPDPAAALEIARLMDVPPGEFAYLGDSAVDMKTATTAGMYPVGALWGFRTADELREAGAGMLIKHPPDLLRLFGR